MLNASIPRSVLWTIDSAMEIFMVGECHCRDATPSAQDYLRARSGGRPCRDGCAGHRQVAGASTVH